MFLRPSDSYESFCRFSEEFPRAMKTCGGFLKLLKILPTIFQGGRGKNWRAMKNSGDFRRVAEDSRDFFFSTMNDFGDFVLQYFHQFSINLVPI